MFVYCKEFNMQAKKISKNVKQQPKDTKVERKENE